jgi:mono/diheme cytochrome c family protein
MILRRPLAERFGWALQRSSLLYQRGTALRSTGALLLLSALPVMLLAGCETRSRALQLIEQYKCRDCHTFKGKGGSVGPNLTNVGGRRDRQYIYQQIQDPRSHNPNTAMPSFGDRMSEQDLNVLADYLSKLK